MALEQRSIRSTEHESFRCGHCRADVRGAAPGTAHRNHCPTCLWSRHLDGDTPGDRAAGCGALMRANAITVRGNCECVQLNRTAGDDDPLMLLRLAVRPLAQPPFPLERIGRL